MNNFELAKQNFEYSQKLRRDFHKNPELGFQEFRTSEIVAKELENFGYEVRKNVGKTGVIGLLKGNIPGPTILLRFDMDALPIQEQNQTEYVSKTTNVMHACGHDAHMSIGLTVAKIFSENTQDVKGNIKFIFQPAEEGLGGALAVIADGVLENPKPDYCLGLHIWNDKPVGWIGVNSGAMMAGADTFQMKVIGKGGHGGVPNLAIDPIVAAAQIVISAQTIVSRNVSPLDQAVISFGSVNGGSAFNIIPDTVQLTGTIRTFNSLTRQLIFDRLMEVSNSIGRAMGCTVEFSLDEITPAVINNPEIVKILEQVIKQESEIETIDNTFRTMGSEDFSLFLNEIPGCFFFVGSANPEKNLVFGHHHPKFDFDEKVLPIAVSCMLGMVENLRNR